MELDDLKQSWNEQSKQELKPLNNDFMEMIHNKSYGPLAELKNSFKRQMIICGIAEIVLFFLIIKKPELFKQLYTTISFFFFGLFTVAWSYYKFIDWMQRTDSSVKETIEKNIKTLEKQGKSIFLLRKFYLALIILLIEFLMYLNILKGLEAWYAYSFFIRVAVYIALFVLIYFIDKYSYQKNFGKHISYLKELLNKIG